MQTKDEIIKNIWSLRKRIALFNFLSGTVISVTLILNPCIIVNDGYQLAGVVIMCFLVLSLLGLILEGNFKKIVNTIMSPSKSRRFILLGNSAYTESRREFDIYNPGVPFNFVFFPGVLLMVALTKEYYPKNILWTSPNIYLVIVMTIIYVYLYLKLAKRLRKIWNDSFLPLQCKVNLRESLPDLFAKCKLMKEFFDVSFVIQRGKNEEEEESKEVATALVAHIKKEYEKIYEIQKEREEDMRRRAIVVQID